MNGDSNLAKNRIREHVETLPKVELHRHLEGSLRLETLVDIAREFNIEVPEYSVETLRPFVQLMPGEARDMQHFLGKFSMLRKFYRTPEIIRRIAREAVIDAARDQVKYMELRFTPVALGNITKAPAREVVSWVCDTVAAAAADCAIEVRLIVSMNRHESVAIGDGVVAAALEFRDKGVVGLDLAGKEDGFSCLPFRHLFKQAKAEGLGITVHAGEWDGAQSVWDAVGGLGADRIGHGIRCLEDPGIVNVLVKRGIALEVCPSSNVDSGVVPNLNQHPLPRLHQLGVRTTINTDDPLLSNLTLTEELTRVITQTSLTLENVKQQTLYAVEAAFLPPAERDTLRAKFVNWFEQTPDPVENTG